ncbi:efflux RND transporter periplasmic adaptor subunit [Nitrincola iocasae]|uniref:Efflux RND transporter periplasmic adaptor subunit n=1 Tax=Nitrincola iocasae TaxID=2614693 RepID=A0A5J6LDT3_9GAMM|nr:efflux RND transporter periplasmic adaptor subunit [Nitrincola iocasae]QEW06789.1 efflux RND transporter periplasmic adaptor subunit [Nitrincola iocasae]
MRWIKPPIGAWLCAFAIAAPAQAIELSVLSCLLEPSLDAELGVPVEGVLARVYADRSVSVERGAVLAELDLSVEQAMIAMQRAREDYASRRLERVQELQSGNLIPAQEVDDIRTEQQLARLELTVQQEQLKLRRVVSPFSGIIVERYADVGDLIQKSHIFRLVQLDPLYVEAVMTLDQFGQVVPGDRYQVSLQHLDTVHDAEVIAVDPVIDAGSGTFRVRLSLPNPDSHIPAGLSCSIDPL